MANNTVNEAFFDALIRHQVSLLRYSASLQKDTAVLLDKTEAAISAAIVKGLSTKPGLNSPRDVKKLNALLKKVKDMRKKALNKVDALWLKELTEMAENEPALVDGLLKTVNPTVLETSLPAAVLLRKLALAKPFEGRSLKEWSKGFAAADLRRIEDQIKIGIVQGEDSKTIARRVVGTKAARGLNGATAITRREASTITRTAINAIANQARRAYYEMNNTLFSKELYVATLDARTTRVCSSLDGNLYNIGVGPIPPLHFNCRSLRVAVVNGLVIGRRPQRPVTQRGLLREWAKREGEPAVLNRDDLPFGSKKAYDAFARARLRELTGTVPAKVTYQQWLGRQSKSFQNDVLGPTRAKLFREGGLDLPKFVNRAGDEIPLRDLAKVSREAFISAGLDPEKYL